MAVQPIPDGYSTVTPYLILRDAARALDFYKKAFGAEELMRMPGPDGKVLHAEFKIGSSMLMMGEECPQMNARSAQTLGGSPIGICLYVENVDARFSEALAAGGKEIRPLKDQFYGDRSGTIEDPFGLQWTISTHKEDVPPDELARRAAECMKEHAGA